MNKIKVLHILYEIQPSGAEMMLFSAYPYWKEKCELFILATGPSEGAYAESLRKKGYCVDYLPIQEGSALGEEKMHKKIQHLWRFRKYIQKNLFDAVHIHKESLSEDYAAICAQCGVKKIVRTVHSTFQFHGILRLRKTHSRIKMQKKYGVRIVAISDGVAANEKQMFGIECDDIIYNWCDDQKFKFVSEKEKKQDKQAANIGDKLTILTSATCNHVKNHELLIRAIRKMKNRDKIFYYHVGYGEYETEREKQIAQELRVDDNIEFAGFTNPQPYMARADLFIMTSIYEGLSISALEAIFSGVHLLLADSRGLIEFQGKGFSGIDYFHMEAENPVSEENVNVLADTLDRLVKKWEKGELKNSLEQRKVAESLYSARQGADKYLKLYL